MKWYGFFKTPELHNNLVKNYKRRLNLRSRTLALTCNHRVGYRFFKIAIYIPTIWKITFLKNKNYSNLFILNSVSDTYFYNFVVPTYLVKWYRDVKTRSVYFIFPFFNNYYNLYWFFFFFVLNSFSQVFFNKIKFRGKGYYVYKNYRQTIAFQFGFSHRIRAYFHFLNVKFLSKTSVFLFGMNKGDIIYASYLFFYKRPINVFTGRGVRFTRQVIYRKPGKVSLYR